MSEREGGGSEVLIDVHHHQHQHHYNHPLEDYHRRLLAGGGAHHTTIEAYVSSSSSSGWGDVGDGLSSSSSSSRLSSTKQPLTQRFVNNQNKSTSLTVSLMDPPSSSTSMATQHNNNNTNTLTSSATNSTLLAPSPHLYSSSHHIHQYNSKLHHNTHHLNTQHYHNNTSLPAKSPRNTSVAIELDSKGLLSSDDFESTSSSTLLSVASPTMPSLNNPSHANSNIMTGNTDPSSANSPSSNTSSSSSYHHRFAYSIYLFINMSQAQIMKQKKVFSIIMLTILCLSLTVLAYMSRHHLGYFLEWISSIGIWGNILFIMVFTAVGFPFMLGYIPLTVGAGYLYGMVMGTATVSIGATCGAGVTFLLCRTLTRKWVEKHLATSSKFNLFMVEVENNAWKITLLTRLLPFPFGLVNGLFALSSISFPVFIIGTAVGLLPFQLMWTYFGTTLRSITEAVNGEMPFGVWQQFLLVLQVGVGVGLCLYMYQLSQVAMRNSEARAAQAAEKKASVSSGSGGADRADVENGSDVGLGGSSEDGMGYDGEEEGDECDDDDDMCEEEEEGDNGVHGVGVGVDVDVDLEVGLEGCKTARGLVHAHTHTISLMDDDMDEIDCEFDDTNNTTTTAHTTTTAQTQGRSLVMVAHKTLYSFVAEASHNWLGVSVKGGGLKQSSNTDYHHTKRQQQQHTKPAHMQQQSHNTTSTNTSRSHNNNTRNTHSFKKGPRPRSSFCKATQQAYRSIPTYLDLDV